MLAGLGRQGNSKGPRDLSRGPCMNLLGCGETLIRPQEKGGGR
jgi:hypothetical protein